MAEGFQYSIMNQSTKLSKKMRPEILLTLTIYQYQNVDRITNMTSDAIQ